MKEDNNSTSHTGRGGFKKQFHNIVLSTKFALWQIASKSFKIENLNIFAKQIDPR